MNKCIHFFETQSDFETAYAKARFGQPWVSYTEGVGTAYSKKYSFNGHDYVDLGLPSGTLWATCNVGASSPEEPGGFYAWGETTTKNTYNWSTYEYGDAASSVTKYTQNDQITVLDPEDDAAHVNMGGDWRMPTEDEVRELINNTTSSIVKLNGIRCCRVTGSNGNSIYLPAYDKKYSAYGGDVNSDGRGQLWSATLLSESYHYLSGYALALGFTTAGTTTQSIVRTNGANVRGVIG